jgi:hypothetical protein
MSSLSPLLFPAPVVGRSTPPRMADSSQTAVVAGSTPPSAGPGQMLLPAGLVRRAGSPCLWIDITWRGTRIRRSSGTADLAEAVLALARIQAEGPPATGERPVAVPTLRHLLTRIEDEHRAGVQEGLSQAMSPNGEKPRRENGGRPHAERRRSNLLCTDLGPWQRHRGIDVDVDAL